MNLANPRPQAQYRLQIGRGRGQCQAGQYRCLFTGLGPLTLKSGSWWLPSMSALSQHPARDRALWAVGRQRQESMCMHLLLMEATTGHSQSKEACRQSQGQCMYFVNSPCSNPCISTTCLSC